MNITKEEISGLHVLENYDGTTQSHNFSGIAIRTVLQDAIEQFNILLTINNHNSILFDTNTITYRDIEERFTGAENHADTRLPCVSTNYDKLSKDINMLKNILIKLSHTVSLNDDFTPLTTSLAVIKTMANDDKWLLSSEVNNQLEIKRLTKQCEEERKAGIEAFEKTCEEIQQLRFAVEYNTIYSQTKTKHFHQWEEARKEQNIQVCNEKEEFYSNILRETQDKILKEQRCHQNFKNYINESRVDMVNEIDYWVKRYDEETETREADMIRMKADLEKMSTEHQEVLNEFEKRKQEMADWKEYKKQREIRRKRAKVEKWASLIIQTWWRAIMVRKRFGPYKKKAKQGKGKK